MATMPAKRDYYEVLGVEKDASHKQIADAYRKLALQYHPDRNPGSDEAIERFKEAAEAFEVLGDQDKRSRYDRFGHAGVDGGPHFQDVGDIFSAFGDIFGEGIFGEFFGGGRRRRPRKGADVACHVTLDLLEAARGVQKTVEFERHEACVDCKASGAKPGTKPQSCPYCGGRGQVVQSAGIMRIQSTCPSCRGSGKSIKDPCPACRGGGYVSKRIRREVTIPPGVDTDTRLRLTGEGEPSPEGGAAGDCQVFIRVKDHPLFQRDGQHLVCHIPITYSQAALGATIEVPTLDGRDELTLPPGTISGHVFKLRGKGIRDLRRHGVGDLLVQVQIEVPKTLSSRQEELLRELAEIERTNVSPHRMSFFDKLKSFILPDQAPAQAEE